MPHVHVQDNFKIQKKLTVTPSLGIFNDDQYNFELVLNSIRMAMTRIRSWYFPLPTILKTNFKSSGQPAFKSTTVEFPK